MSSAEQFAMKFDHEFNDAPWQNAQALSSENATELQPHVFADCTLGPG